MALEATVTPTDDVKESRQSVIAAAVAAAGAEDVKETEVKEKEVTEVPKKEVEKVKEEPQNEEALLAEQGKQLMLALRDPERAGIVIDFLAKQAGYSKGELKAAAGDKETTTEITDDILSIIKGEMGEEFDIISERLAKALNKILPKQLEKSTADIRQEMQNREAEKLRGQSAAALETLTTGFFGDGEKLPDNVASEMSKYMDRVNPSPTMSVKEFVEDAFHSAIGKLGLVKSDKVKSGKTEKNRIDAASRLASERGPSANNLKQDTSKPLTRQQAIAAAIEAASKE